MEDQQGADITERATLGKQFPLRLMQLGFQLMQGVDGQGRDLFRYVVPPVCMVPAGPVLMGSDEHRDEEARTAELPQHTVTLETYHIGAYPLTVAEYACFVQATQHREPALQGDPAGSDPTWKTQQAEHADHPVVYVSWHDVLAYARWLSQVTGDVWRLPSEAEWEKAARGTDGRLFPWGDEWDQARANTKDGGLRDTTPVGAFTEKGDASPYGVHDLAGNVLEWTSTIFKSYPYQAGDGREDLDNQTVPQFASPREEYEAYEDGRFTYPQLKVMRGGSRYYESACARATWRMGRNATLTFSDLGGRLVRGGMASDAMKQRTIGRVDSALVNRGEMSAHPVVEDTDPATPSGQIPTRLRQLGFRSMQAMDEQGHVLYWYIVPPVCDVPAGPFLMGSLPNDQGYIPPAEYPQSVITVPAFQIGRYPLTVAEYTCAVRAGVVTEPMHKGLQQQPLDHPVDGITWVQAGDYARWLAGLTGDRWRLPTEAEWEKAARGTDGRLFPWGNTWDTTRANTAEDGPWTTTPIGNYLQGASPYGAQEMAGNVLEWTSSRFVDYPYRSEAAEDNEDTTSERVLRGGSASGDLILAQTASRWSEDPNGLGSVNFGGGTRLARVY